MVTLSLPLQLGRSPLSVACEGGHTDTAQLLIDKGANVNQCDEVYRVSQHSNRTSVIIIPPLHSLVNHYFLVFARAVILGLLRC